MMEWISIEERLPDNSEPVLINVFEFNQSSVQLGYLYKGNWFASEGDYIEAEGGWDGAVINSTLENENVTHWMPLPDPPKTIK